MKIKIILLLLFFTCMPLLANETAFDQASEWVGELEQIYQRGEQGDYALTPVAENLCNEISQITIIKRAGRDYYVDLWWLRAVAESLKSEPAAKKRKLIFANMVDTLAGLLRELSSEAPKNGATRQEMLDALERAMNRTREIKVAPGAPVGEAIEWAGGGSFVCEGAGDGISIVGADATGYSGSSGGSSGYVSGGSSGNYYGGTTHSGSSSGGVSVSGNFNQNLPQQPTQVSSGGSYSSPQSNSSNSHSNTLQSNQTAAQPVSQPARVNHPQSTPKPQPPKPQPPRPPKPPEVPKAPTKISDFIFYIILGICIVAMLIMIYLMIRRTRRKIAQEQEEIGRMEATLPPERMKIETIYDKALAAAGRGDFAEGIRLLTIGALLLLEQQRVVNFQDSMTNGEYLRYLLKERSLYSMFKEPMSLFDLLIYGFKKPGQSEFEKFRQFYVELEKVHR